jgi:hypothetical protein
VTALTNGNYVVLSPFWNNGAVIDAGAVTFGNGTTGISGVVSAANSLVGSTALDRVGFEVGALRDGNYVVLSPIWDDGAVADAGAATFGKGTTGISGAVSAANSLVGSTTGDQVGRGGAILHNGNYLVYSSGWDNGALVNAGAVTFGNGTTGVKGTVTAANSALGAASDSDLQDPVLDNENDTFFARFLAEEGGIIRVGSQIDGFNAPPAVGNFGGNLTYTENGAAILLTTTATVSDVDSPNFSGGQLRVSFISGGVGSDRFAIRSQGTEPGQINVQGNQVRFGTLVIGTFTGGVGTAPLVVSLQGAATPARVQALLRSITFRNVNGDPPGAARTVRAFLSDGDGEAVSRSKQITITRTNDAPELTPEAGATVGYTRGDPPVGLLTSATVLDPDSLNFGGGRLLVRVTSGGHASNRLLIGGGFVLDGNQVKRISDGLVIGTRNGNGGEGTTRLEITLTADATPAIVQQLVRGIRFRTAGASPTTQRTIEFSLTDGDGGASNRVNVAVNVS